MKSFAPLCLAVAALVISSPAFANVLVSSPSSNATVSTQTTFVASANTTTCSRGVAAMGVYVDNGLRYVVNGTQLNTSIALTPGSHNAVVQEWDYCGGATTTAVPVTVAGAGKGGVVVTLPTPQSTVSAQSSFVASATSDCPAGIAAIGVYDDDQLVHQEGGGTLNAQVTLHAGLNHTVVQAWDACGGVSKAPVDVTVAAVGNTINDIQDSTGWKSSGQIAPYYSDCVPNCPGVTWGMEQKAQGPSNSAKLARVDLGGTTPYSDVLYFNQLIGDYSSQGMLDLNRTQVPSLHEFTYDADFYMTDGPHTQAMEFDINWFMHSVGITWGTECRVAGGNEWDIWDNVNAHWIPTGIACNPVSNGWNHVTVAAERGPNNEVIYKSITLNGKTAVLNKTYAPFWVPYNWYGVTVNYQMDGDLHQTAISSYVDHLNLNYK